MSPSGQKVEFVCHVNLLWWQLMSTSVSGCIGGCFQFTQVHVAVVVVIIDARALRSHLKSRCRSSNSNRHVIMLLRRLV